MSSDKAPRHGFQVALDELTAQVAALAEIGEETSGLVASASRLAERRPMLGTAPPAAHLAMRLRDAAGKAGLTGEVGAADAELSSFHRALRATVTRYLEGDRDIAWTFATTGDGTAE